MTPWNRDEFSRMFAPAAIGMVHLLPLPGSPLWMGDLEVVRNRALADATALTQAGFRAAMVENFQDVPFFPGRVPAVTVAAMTAVIVDILRKFPDLLLGVNVLRNDVQAALGIAAATGANFVRVNVHVGEAVTDQGTIRGQACRTLRLRKDLGVERVGILADVRVKHARPLVERPLAEEARDLRLRGLADCIIVSGPATGQGADPEELRLLRQALPDCPLLVGSGMTSENVSQFRPWADGYIVGTSLREQTTGANASAISSVKSTEFLASLAG
ncbi:MAG: BtpA/SgcQ family protein [Gemmatimonadales bacterium]|nr:BtpA/SgcQ family protein [Gemmatimonadales bacterium]